jgi:ribosomal protein S1
MATEQELKNKSIHKEFQIFLDQDFKDRKLKENEIIKATVTEITKNFIVVDCKAKMEGMIPLKNLKMMMNSKIKSWSQIDVYLRKNRKF